MTFEEFLEKGEGNIYIAKKYNPVRVSEIECIAVTTQVAKQRNYFYFGWYETRQNYQYILAKKSKDKRRVRHDGIPSVVYINSVVPYMPFNNDDLGQNRLEKNGYIVFTSKDDACNYVIDQIKRKKLELNKYILAVNKLKFNLEDGDK